MRLITLSSYEEGDKIEGEKALYQSQAILYYPKVSGVRKGLQRKISDRPVPCPGGEVFVGLGHIWTRQKWDS